MLSNTKELELIMDPIQLTTKETLQVNILNNTKDNLQVLEHMLDNIQLTTKEHISQLM